MPVIFTSSFNTTMKNGNEFILALLLLMPSSLLQFNMLGHEEICWRWVSTYVGAVYRYHTQHTVVVEGCQGYKKKIKG